MAGGGENGTVGKALSLLDLIARSGKPVRFVDLQGSSGLPKATLHRFLRTLCNEGMLVHDRENRSYNLGIRLVRLAHSAWKQASLGEVARSHIDSLAERIGETIHLAQLENGQVLYIDKRNSVAPVEMSSYPGKVGPAYCTGVGKAMLAFLDEPMRSLALEQQAYFAYTPNTLTSPSRLRRELELIRNRGLALDREEHEPGIICIACPIQSRSRLVGALSITSSVRRRDVDSLLSYRPLLEQTARTIGEEAEVWQLPA